MIEIEVDQNILIAYGSEYGSTAEIAERIGEILRDKGIKITLLNVNKQKKIVQQDLDEYTGFLLGSGIYAGGWSNKMKKFLKKNATQMKRKTVAGFAVCGEVHNPERIDIARTNFVDNYLKKYNITPDFGVALAGVVDLSPTTQYNKLEQKIIRLINKKDPVVSLTERNDFRDWEQVHKFAEEFAHLFQLISATKPICIEN